MVNLGQIYTKSNIANYMVSLLDLPKSARILEPCYGKGVFLDSLVLEGFKNVTACEIDKQIFESTKIKYSKYKLLNMNFLEYQERKNFDGIIMNPPYIRQEEIDELSSIGITKEKIRSFSIFSELSKTANMYMYFIIKAIDLLKKGGQLIVIFPTSWMNSKTGEDFYKLLISKCGIERKIYVYGDIFEKQALVEVVIFKLIKGKLNINSKEEHLESKGGKLNLSSDSIKLEKVFNLFSYPFCELATVKRGLETGCNAMYINPNLDYKDENYLKPIISSPKSILGYTTLNAKEDKLLLPITGELPKEIVEYLNSWKIKIINKKSPKTLYSKIIKNENWYNLREQCSNGILFSYFIRDDMKFIMNETEILARDNFYIIKPKIKKLILFSLLNNYYTYYQLEITGKRYGAGLLKIQKYDIEKLKFPEYHKISQKHKEKLESLGLKLLKTGNKENILEITKIISIYSKINYKEIIEMFFDMKSHRLENN